MRDIEGKIGEMPPGSVTLNDELYLEALQRPRMIDPDGFRARKIREWLAADGLSDEEIEKRMAVATKTSNRPGFG